MFYHHYRKRRYFFNVFLNVANYNKRNTVTKFRHKVVKSCQVLMKCITILSRVEGPAEPAPDAGEPGACAEEDILNDLPYAGIP